MNTKVYVYFLKNRHGYELEGDAIISGYEAFMHKPETYLIEFSYSDIIEDYVFHVYEWKGQRRTLGLTHNEMYLKQRILEGIHADLKLPQVAMDKIYELYLAEENQLEAEANS